METIIKPTEAELDILNVLWQNGPSSVRFVNDKLNERRETGYTTTLKFMQLMTGKKLVSRSDENRQHVYTAAVDEVETRTQLLEKLMNSAFRGSATQLVMQALGNNTASSSELAEIKELIAKLEGGKV